MIPLLTLNSMLLLEKAYFFTEYLPGGHRVGYKLKVLVLAAVVGGVEPNFIVILVSVKVL